MGLSEKFDLKVEHSEEKKVTIEGIIECVYGKRLTEVADHFNKQGIVKEAG